MKAAAEETAKFMVVHLRNAVAHGIVYLDKDCRLNEQPAAMLGFVSAKIDWKTQKLEGLHISRVSEPDFQKFLVAWSDWIERSGVSTAVSSSPALAA